MATEKVNFTNTLIKSIPHPEKGRVMYRDTKCSHLYLYATPKAKVYYFVRWIKGKSIQIKLAPSNDVDAVKARDMITELNTKIANGIDLLKEKNEGKNEITLAELFELYAGEKDREKKTINIDRQKINGSLKAFKNQKLSSITYAKFKIFHKSLRETPYQANRCFALMSVLFNYAIRELKIKLDNPCVGVKKYKEHARQRILNNLELKRFLDVLNKWEHLPFQAMYSDIFKMLLYTGQRKNNVLSMRFASINFETKTWVLNPEDTKNKEYHTVPLQGEAFDIVSTRYKQIGKHSKHVFPSPVYPDRPIVEPKKQWVKLLKEAKLSNLRIHDIRRSLGAMLLMSGADLKTVSKILGHKDSSITDRIYTPILDEYKREALDRAFKGMSFDEDKQVPFKDSKGA